MTDPNIALIDYIRKIGMDNDVDFLREGLRFLSQRLIELEAEQ